jgi:methionyl aminopeptidase
VEPEIALKTAVEVARIRRSCRLAQATLRALGPLVHRGVTTSELDRKAERFIRDAGGEPALKGYRGFPASICASANNVCAHGIPGDAPLEDGDVIGIDVTVRLDGWYGDAAWTFVVGRGSEDARRLVRAAWRACLAGLVSVKPGGRLGDVGAAISRTAARLGCSVIRDYVGHGIGKAMHEEPRIVNFGRKGQGMRIVPGMVFTVEPMVSLGGAEVKVMDDGWTVVTADGSLSAQFEHTVAVYREGIEILTLPDTRLRDCLDEPPYFQ